MEGVFTGLRVIGKNHRHFDAQGNREAWDLYEYQCSTGEGATCNVRALDFDQWNLAVPFVEYDAVIEAATNGYRTNLTMKELHER